MIKLDLLNFIWEIFSKVLITGAEVYRFASGQDVKSKIKVKHLFFIIHLIIGDG